ncbi:MAG TPA: acyl carrier protein [Micromonosporaceae bacterium]|nr:acyl carrier protein [Micromonosporaceae bacterium]
MSTTTQDRKAQIRDVVCDILEIDAEELTEESLFKEDHDADSLRAIEILAALEKTFGIIISQTELVRLVNLAGVYAVVAEASGWE